MIKVRITLLILICLFVSNLGRGTNVSIRSEYNFSKVYPKVETSFDTSFVSSFIANDSLISEENSFKELLETGVIDVVVDSFMSHFNQLLKHNRRNDSLGQSQNNKYFMAFVPYKSFDINNCTPEYVKKGPFLNENWFLPNPQTIDYTCQFNNNSTGTNYFNVKHYAIFFGLPTNGLNTLLEQTIKATPAIAPYLSGTNASQNKVLFNQTMEYFNTKIEEKLNLSDTYGTPNLIITLSSYYNFKVPFSESVRQRTITKSFYVQNEILIEPVFNGFLQKSNNATLFNDGTKDLDLGLDFLDTYFGDYHKRLVGFLEFFSNPDNVNVDFDCNEISFQNEFAEDFRDCKCLEATNLEQKRMLRALVDCVGLYYNKVPFVVYDAINNPNFDFCTQDNWFKAIWDDFKMFHTDNPTRVQESYKTFLLEKSLALKDPHYFYLWIINADLEDYHGLSNSYRLDILKLLRYFDFNSWTEVDISLESNASTSQIVVEIFDGCLVNSASDAKSFLASIDSDPAINAEKRLIKWLFDKGNGWFDTDESEKNIFTAITNVAIYAEGGISTIRGELAAEKGLVWLPDPWWANFKEQFAYNYTIGAEPLSYIGLTMLDSDLFSYRNNNVSFSGKPFDIIPIIKGKDIHFYTHGSNLLSTDTSFTIQCEPSFFGCTEVFFLPYITAAFYIEKLNEDLNLEMGVAFGQAVGALFGYSQMMILAKLANAGGTVNKVVKARALLSGFAATADVADLFGPNMAGFAMEAAGVDPELTTSYVNQIKKTTGFFAVSSNAALALDGLIGIGRYWWMTKAGAAFTSGDHLPKLVQDIAKFSRTYPEYVPKILAQRGITSPAVAEIVLSIPAIRIENRIALLSELVSDAELALKINKNPIIVSVIKEIVEAADVSAAKTFLSLDKARKLELYNDIEQTAGLGAHFVQNVKSVSAWHILGEAGTALKTDVIALSKINFLKTKGFSDANLRILGEADDIKVLSFAEGFALRNIDVSTTMSRHAKMMEIKGLSGAQEFTKYQDDINSLMKAQNTSGDFLLQNPNAIPSSIQSMNTGGGGNPFLQGGHDFEIEWALDIANQGRNVRLDASNLPDVLDDIGFHAYQLKKLNGEGQNSLGTNAATAVNQIKPTGSGPAPANYTKNVVIKINNSSHPQMNSSKDDLINFLSNYNINNGQNQSGTLNGMDKFIIKNNTGHHEILGSQIDF